MSGADHLAGGERPVAGVVDGAALRHAVHRRQRVGAERVDRRDQVAAEVVDVDPAEPRRGAGLTDLQEVAVGERHGRQPRLDLAHPLSRDRWEEHRGSRAAGSLLAG
jgi:hypothetical protein